MNPERSFDFVTSEVRTQLVHLPAQQVEDILTLLGGFENTVFETRTMPRMPPVRQLDMDITETSDARPVAMRHYPVAPQHMPELERQIKALSMRVLFAKVSVCMHVPSCLHQKKMANCVCVSTIVILTDRPFVIATPYQLHLIWFPGLEGHTYFLNWTCNQASTSCAYAKGINTKPRLPLQVANMNGSMALLA